MLDLTEQVIAGVLVAVNQAIYLRKRQDNPPVKFLLSENVSQFIALIARHSEFLSEDTFLEPRLRGMLKVIDSMDNNLY